MIIRNCAGGIVFYGDQVFLLKKRSARAGRWPWSGCASRRA